MGFVGSHSKHYPDKKIRSHRFKEGAEFADAVALYYFDSNLRTILAEYLYRIEINFRTNLIYNVSNHYKADGTVFKYQ